MCKKIDRFCTPAWLQLADMSEGPRRLLIKGGTVVNADRKFRADVYCEDGIIRSARPALCPAGGEICASPGGWAATWKVYPAMLKWWTPQGN